METPETYPIRKYEKEVFTNEDVITYMTAGSPCPHFVQMPPTLQLQEFTPYYEHLYRNFRNVPFNPAADLFVAQKMDLFPFLRNPELQGVVDQLRQAYSLQAPGERSSVIYLDRNTYDYVTTPIVYGDISSTPINFGHVLSEGGIPVMDVHTHPNNAFFSTQDFNALLVSVFKNGQPFTQASAVLCPDYQLVAVATGETPLMSQDRFEELKREYEPSIEEQERMNELMGRLHQLDLIVAKNHYETLVEYDILLQELRAEFADDDPEVRRRLESWLEEMKRYNEEEFRPKLSRVIPKILDNYFKYLYRVVNDKQIAFARDMNIKLYMATDGAHFTEFTA